MTVWISTSTATIWNTRTLQENLSAKYRMAGPRTLDSNCALVSSLEQYSTTRPTTLSSTEDPVLDRIRYTILHKYATMQPPGPTPHTPLVEACRPRTSLGCLFSDADVAGLRAWMASGAPGPALATAVPGSGLTTLVHLLVRECGLDAVWVGCATPRVKAVLQAAGSSPVSVTLRRKIIVIDEIEALAAGGDAAALSDALAFVKAKPPLPVLFLGHVTRSQKAQEFAKAWPRFAFGRPSAPAVGQYLRRVASQHAIPADAVDDIAAKARGDVRAALMALDLLRRGTGTVDFKDEAPEGLDLTEAVLRGAAGHGVKECLRLFAMEPAVLPMGMWENYLGTLGKDDLAAVAEAADGFADADRVDRHMYSKQAWDAMDTYGVCAVAVPALALRRLRRSKPPKTVSVTKFGSVWSRLYNTCAKTKHVKALALAFAERGVQPLGACDLAWVRGCLRHAVASGDEAALRGVCGGVCGSLAAADVLKLARLDAGPGGSAWYTQATHARVKAALGPA